jgi:hypothetical protein
MPERLHQKYQALGVLFSSRPEAPPATLSVVGVPLAPGRDHVQQAAAKRCKTLSHDVEAAMPIVIIENSLHHLIT